MSRAGYIPIDRRDRRKAFASMNRVAEIVRQGTSVYIFPEGTRSADGVFREFKKGVFVLAVKSGQPIIPISISGSYRILPKDSWMIHPGEIRISIGSPIRSAGEDAQQPRRPDGGGPRGDPRQFDDLRKPVATQSELEPPGILLQNGGSI